VPHESAPSLLVLHAVRIKGMADTAALARRFGVDRAETEELLLDFEAFGWVQRSSFAGVGGWSLTERGKAENERVLASELAESGARPVVTESHESFAQLNERFLGTITKWQIRPVPGDPMAANDHTDHRWDDRVFESLGSLSRRLRPVADALSSALTRFDGYPDRFAAALGRASRGEHRYVDEPGTDSCHTIWFELHEDLIATLGLTRGTQP
jgi:hypothetical protein